MTKKESNWIDIIVSVVETARTVDIDNIIIEPNCVRAIDDAKTVVLFQNENVPSISIGSIGMNRIGTFMQRYKIIEKQESPSFDADVDEDKGYVRSIKMRSSDTKIEYRCANPDTIQAPRKINDAPKFKILVPPSSGALMKNAQSAMSSEIVEIKSDKNGVSFKLLDINNDGFTHTFAERAEVIEEDDDSDAFFSHKYPVKNVLAVLHPNIETMFEIGEKGIMTTSLNGLNVLLLPQV